MILNYINQLNNVQINYDEDMWSDDLVGMFDFGVTETRLLSIQEYYPDL